MEYGIQTVEHICRMYNLHCIMQSMSELPTLFQIVSLSIFSPSLYIYNYIYIYMYIQSYVFIYIKAVDPVARRCFPLCFCWTLSPIFEKLQLFKSTTVLRPTIMLMVMHGVSYDRSWLDSSMIVPFFLVAWRVACVVLCFGSAVLKTYEFHSLRKRISDTFVKIELDYSETHA